MDLKIITRLLLISLAASFSARIIGTLDVIVIANYFLTGTFNWLEHMPRAWSLGTVPLIALAAVLLFYFYLCFYRFLDRTADYKVRRAK